MFEVEMEFGALAVMPPGPELATVLAGITLGSVNGYVRVLVMQAWERQSSWAAARMYEAMSYVARSPECVPDSQSELTEHYTEFASAEVGAALTLTPWCADRELSLAYHLTERLPGTQAALVAGRISLAKAKEIADETAVLSDELARRAEDFILADAAQLTRQQIARQLRAMVLRLDPEGAEKRRREAQRDRQVRFEPDGTGTASISGTSLPVAQVAAARAFVKAIAKAIHDTNTGGDGGDDDRTLAQVEADVVLDLLQGRPLDTHGIKPKVELVAPLETWLTLSEQLGLDNSPDDHEPADRGADRVADVGEHANPAPSDSQPVKPRPADGEPVKPRPANGEPVKPEPANGEPAAPRELVGFGAVSPEVLAEIIAMAGHDFDYCSTVTRDGQVVFHQRSRYRPTRSQRELIRARDRFCRHPGCTRTAARCDADHTMEHRLGGPTCACNLVSLCRRHHRAKHQGGWWWTHTTGGALTVQGPLGHTYCPQPQPPLGADVPRAESRPRRQSVLDHLARGLRPDGVRLSRAEVGSPF